MSSNRHGNWNWRDVPWALATSAQGGLLIALPVVAGLALGYWLDGRFGTLPWITLVLTLIGALLGPVLLYRWVMSVVQRRMERKQDEENS
jgi:F0F1-type ATP synthase assembly protein I